MSDEEFKELLDEVFDELFPDKKNQNQKNNYCKGRHNALATVILPSKI